MRVARERGAALDAVQADLTARVDRFEAIGGDDMDDLAERRLEDFGLGGVILPLHTR